MGRPIANCGLPTVDCRWGLAVVVGLFCALGAIHSVVVPLFEAPDELWHFSFIRVLATERSLPVQPMEGKDMWLREAGQPPLYYVLAAPFVAPLDTSDFPGFVRFNEAHPAITPHSQSEAPNVFIHTPHEAFPYQGAVLAIHIVRLLTVLWGAGAVVSTYLVAREIAPDRPSLALAAAAVTAFNPHFVYISGVVNNDACAVCLCTLALWLAVRLQREPRLLSENRVSRSQKSPASELALGLVLGLALLSKVSALALLALVPLALGLVWWRDRDARALLVRGATILGPAALVAAWWYVRNWVLYGDPLAWRVWLIDIGVHPIGPLELLRQFGHVATSFWAPYDGLFPAPIFWTLGLLLALVVAGWVRFIVRRSARSGMNTEGLLLVGVWLVLLFASLVRYMTTTPSAEGRLLFPGLAASSSLLVLGWDLIVPRRWMGWVTGLVTAGLLALSLFSPFCAIAPRYALPLLASRDDASGEVPLGDATFGSVSLLGVEVEPDEVQAGETVAVTLYWEAHASPPDDLRAVMRLWTLGGQLVGQRDTTPAGDSYPPDLWRAGDLVRDVYRLRVDEEGPAMCHVVVTVMAGDETWGEASSSGLLKLVGAPVLARQIEHPLAHTLGDQVELVGYSVHGASPGTGEALALTFYWRALAEMEENYTVFVHLLGKDGTLYGQGDGPPLNNDYPTSHWAPGELLADTHLVPLEEGFPPGAYLLVGLYRLTDGVRLPAHTAAGERLPDDAIPIPLSPVD
jgi:4-amino-4-deoxy-L-arabinose transferase-like glycosyltransferase